jgi:hypothetical protein
MGIDMAVTSSGKEDGNPILLLDGLRLAWVATNLIARRG